MEKTFTHFVSTLSEQTADMFVQGIEVNDVSGPWSFVSAIFRLQPLLRGFVEHIRFFFIMSIPLYIWLTGQEPHADILVKVTARK